MLLRKNKRMKRLLPSFTLFISALLPAQKIASVDLASVMHCLPEYKPSMEQVDSLLCVLEDQLRQMQDELQSAYNKYQHYSDHEDIQPIRDRIIALQDQIVHFQQEALKFYNSFLEKITSTLKNKAS